jgi:hypothetical protein
MKQFLLASALIAVPVSGFTVVELVLPREPAASETATPESLGDLTALQTIVANTQQIAKSGNLAAAETRITDFETQWDDAEATMRPKAPDAWGNVDAAADDALSALRRSKPDPGAVTETLAALSSVLANPSGKAGAGGPVGLVSGIGVTDANGHPIPCEVMLADLRTALASEADATKKAAANDLQIKATERCNADDDTRADAFSAQALAIASH